MSLGTLSAETRHVDPIGAIRGALRVPGDKSISHRALILGALAVGETQITGLLEAEDVLNTAAAMRAFGAEVTRDPDGIWHVWGRGVGGFSAPDNVLDFGGLKVYVDAMSGMYLEGVKIDYVESLEGSGFKIENPNASGTCGCGHSFQA